jgi:hypothetical protein
VTKRILVPGKDLGKPGQPFTVKISLKGYFAATAGGYNDEVPIENKAKRPGKNPNRKEFNDDKVTPGDVFWDTQDQIIEMTLGDQQVPYGLWKAI